MTSSPKAVEPQPRVIDSGTQRRPRLRFAVNAANDESIPGMLAKGVREHVMEYLSIALDGANIKRYTPGAIQILTKEEAARLAHVLRVEPAIVLARTGIARSNKLVAFDDLILQKDTFEFRQRRIGPAALKVADHHRSSWLNRFLPYCPVTGELLVSQCDHCDHSLGWFSTWGIAVCERCGETVSSSREEGLPDEMMDSYRAFSDLWSLEKDRRTGARKLLPIAFDGKDFSVLFSLSLKLAALFHFGSTKKCELRNLKDVPSRELASIVASSYDIVKAWPESLTNGLETLVAPLSDRHSEFIHIWAWLKKAGNPKISGTEQSDVLLAAMPELAGNVWRSFKQDVRTYTSSEALLKLGTKSPRLRKLADGKHVPTWTLPSRSRSNRRYDADSIDELARNVKDSTTFASASQKHGIPVYGVEQLAAIREIELYDNASMAILFDRVRLSSSSIDNLIKSIVVQRKKFTRSRQAVALKDCATIFSGGEKPWGVILKGLGDGTIPFWGCERGFNLRDIYIDRDSLEHLTGPKSSKIRPNFELQEWVTKEDAQDLLSTSVKGVQAAIDSGQLQFDKKGKGFAQDKETVLKLARKIASVGELCYILRVHPKKLATHRSMTGLSKTGFGYCRASLIKRGVLPTLAENR